MILFVVCACALLPGCLGGGCYDTQKNFQVTPAESCIEPVFDVCDAQADWLTVKNNCADPLVILKNPGADSGASQGEVTVAAGAKDQIYCASFTDTSNSGLWHVAIPARLGNTAITITFDIAR